jgi:hypothetical protein
MTVHPQPSREIGNMDDNEFIPRVAVREPNDAMILSNACEQMAAAHMRRYTDGHKCPDPAVHLDLANRYMDLAVELSKAKEFAETLADIRDL